MTEKEKNSNEDNFGGFKDMSFEEMMKKMIDQCGPGCDCSKMMSEMMKDKEPNCFSEMCEHFFNKDFFKGGVNND